MHYINPYIHIIISMFVHSLNLTSLDGKANALFLKSERPIGSHPGYVVDGEVSHYCFAVPAKV
jgi:hypothetical protein